MMTRLFALAAVLCPSPPCARACEPACPRGVRFTFHDIEPAELPERIPLPELHALEFVNVRLSAARLRRLLATTRVRSIRFRACPVGDDACAVLAEHDCLVEVSLVGTRVTDDGLAMLARLERLRVVDLRGTRVSCAAVAALVESSGVTFVDTRGTGMRCDAPAAVADRD